MYLFQLDAESANADSNELVLHNVGSVFVVLIAGALAAFFITILELVWNCRKIAVEEKVSCFSSTCLFPISHNWFRINNSNLYTVQD